MTIRKSTIGGFLAVLAIPLLAALASETADAARRDRNRENLNRMERYCRQHIRPNGVQCKARQCPCGIGWRRVNTAFQRRSRQFCACVPKNARIRTRNIFRQDAARSCEYWNRQAAGKNWHCVVTAKCRPKNRLDRAGYRMRAGMKVFTCKRPGRITRD